MRYATTPGWVYVMLIVMGVGFMAGAVAFVMFAPAPTGTIVGGIWFVMGAGFVFFSVRALRGGRDDERIRHDGIACQATVLAAKSTGWFVNGVPQWALRLKIEGAGAPYEASLKLQTFNPPSNGASFGVRIDPARRDHVVLSTDGDGAGTGPLPATDGDAGAAGLEASVLAALRQAGVTQPGVSTTINADGSRTISSTSVTVGGRPDVAETVPLLAELERMHANGTLADAEFDALKRKLLGEA